MSWPRLSDRCSLSPLSGFGSAGIVRSASGKRNPHDLATRPYRLIAPAMQQAKQSFGTRLQLLARLTLNAGKHTGNQPARLAHLDDGNDCAILVQGDEGPAQVVKARPHFSSHAPKPNTSYRRFEEDYCYL